LTWIRPFATSRLPSPTSKSSRIASDLASSTPADALSVGAPWKVPYGALVRRSRLWGPRTRGLPPRGTSTSASRACSRATPKPTTRPLV
jgi:hypothetical protein